MKAVKVLGGPGWPAVVSELCWLLQTRTSEQHLEGLFSSRQWQTDFCFANWWKRKQGESLAFLLPSRWVRVGPLCCSETGRKQSKGEDAALGMYIVRTGPASFQDRKAHGPKLAIFRAGMTFTSSTAACSWGLATLRRSMADLQLQSPSENTYLFYKRNPCLL